MAMSETAYTLYDIHAAVRRLTAASTPEPHAETVVGEQVHLIQHNLTTKTDIEQVHADVEGLWLATRTDIETLRQETKADVETAKSDIVKWIVAMNFATVTMLAGLAVVALKLL